jgi:hypothetical protein
VHYVLVIQTLGLNGKKSDRGCILSFFCIQIRSLGEDTIGVRALLEATDSRQSLPERGSKIRSDQ